MDTGSIMSLIDEKVFGVWFLIGAALVFWMQAGFAMVETGFARAKNAGNILMKNLMDFCIGTVTFILIGFGLFLGEDALAGFLGLPSFDIFTDYAHFDWSNFVFNLVFCATTATIVSGAMAERTRFLSYCVYSAIISAVIYPIEAHWTWGGGWLAKLGFHDFAGSNCIHMVGGICALIGAIMVGPRIGKFVKDKAGKVTKVNAFPGHNITLGALGVFILWLGWYGFNGAAATSVEQLGAIFVTTTIAPAVATVVCMIFTWIHYGKPDVSMCLNASLAGLVAITAPCDVVDAAGASIIGAISGLVVIFGIWLLDHKLHVDDPVGAVGVHMCNGIFGTLAVGLFATDTAPTYALADSSGNPMLGLFYGGGFKLLGIQTLGMLATAAWTAITITITFAIIKKIFGLRVTEEEELTGLDITEHGLASAYSGFSIMDVTGMEMSVNENTDLGVSEYGEGIQQPLFLAIDEIWAYINQPTLNPQVHISENAYIFDIKRFTKNTIREAVLNAITHRSMIVQNDVVIKQSPMELTITNAGGFPIGVDKSNVLTVNSTPRSKRLAEVLQKTGLVEKSGQGVDKMLTTSSSFAPRPFMRA